MLTLRTTILFLSITLSSSFSNQQTFPSFDCARASTASEKTICSDDDLSQLDKLLAIIYRLALDNTPTAAQTKTTQIQWLKERPSDRENLIHSYEKRIQELLSDKTIFPHVINYLTEGDKNIKEKTDPLKAILATYLIDKQYSYINEKPSFNERAASDLYFLPDSKVLVLYCIFRGPYNTTFKAYIIDPISNAHLIKEVQFPKYDSILKQIKLENTVISPNFSRSTGEIVSYEKGAGYGGFSRNYSYKIENNTAILQMQQATKDNFDSTYQLTGDDKTDWIVEYPTNLKK
ncbi:lysozyme inhibitor LprI family protein [Candidatus Odyssella acanthamoebae]|uniref:lysozyme inhibitor LprI family protein n=1 Tax=Candidatus Odyssella acanthamoebae TaxID=91604 RepID=UPI000AFA5A84|nr:hypothetical protein [Candidatus Paracaedibacter acanthamoebae]